MMYSSKSEALKFTANFPLHFSHYANLIYSDLDKHVFKNEICTPKYWNECVQFIINSYHQDSKVIEFEDKTIFDKQDNNKVVVAFSGGLDSVYQALYLRNNGYDVTLLHVKNMNKYTNGQEAIAAKEFAERFNFNLEIVDYHAVSKHKEWNENPFKTSLCYALCLDYCLHTGTRIISSGDDMRLNAVDTDLDNNFGDCREVTELFFKNFDNITYLPVDDNIHKGLRLEYLSKNNARDYYYSTTTPGRLVKYLHDLNEKKFNVKLDKWCALSERKDCMHCLLEYYYSNVNYPEKMIEHCWNKIAIGPDKNFFGKHLSLEKRIQNLVDY